jgi:hypothetical protein
MAWYGMVQCSNGLLFCVSVAGAMRAGATDEAQKYRRRQNGWRSAPDSQVTGPVLARSNLKRAGHAWKSSDRSLCLSDRLRIGHLNAWLPSRVCRQLSARGGYRDVLLAAPCSLHYMCVSILDPRRALFVFATAHASPCPPLPKLIIWHCLASRRFLCLFLLFSPTRLERQGAVAKGCLPTCSRTVVSCHGASIDVRGCACQGWVGRQRLSVGVRGESLIISPISWKQCSLRTQWHCVRGADEKAHVSILCQS